MGLDMYLYKKTYIKNFGQEPPEKKHTISIKFGGKKRKDIKSDRISYVVEEVAYWRKFNALHGWIVENCADGLDNCQEIYIGEERLVELLSILKKVKSLIDKSKKVVKVEKDWSDNEYEVEVFDCEDEVIQIFSPTPGFFFGSYNIDDNYSSDVNETILIIEKLIKENEESKQYGLFSGDFYYNASW